MSEIGEVRERAHAPGWPGPDLVPSSSPRHSPAAGRAWSLSGTAGRDQAVPGGSEVSPGGAGAAAESTSPDTPSRDEVSLSLAARGGLATSRRLDHLLDRPSVMDDLGAELGDLVAGWVRQGEVEEAISSGQPVEFTSSQDATFSLTIGQPQPAEDGLVSYQVSLDGQEVTIRIQDGVDPHEAIAAILDLWSEYPPELRDELKEVDVYAGGDIFHDPSNPDSVDAAARGGEGKIWFFHGMTCFNSEVFHHEMGHVVGDAIEDQQAGYLELLLEAHLGYELEGGYVPEGYTEAMEQDGNSVSAYGDTSEAEDFAEFWQAYMEAQAAGPKALWALSVQYPHRFEIAHAVYTGQLEEQEHVCRHEAQAA